MVELVSMCTVVMDTSETMPDVFDTVYQQPKGANTSNSTWWLRSKQDRPRSNDQNNVQGDVMRGDQTRTEEGYDVFSEACIKRMSTKNERTGKNQ